MRKAIPIILLLIVLVLVLALAACETGGVVKETTPNYSIIYIEGMPCLVVDNRTSNFYHVLSVTCDWSRWQPGGEE